MTVTFPVKPIGSMRPMVSALEVVNLRPNAANAWTPVCVNEQIFHLEAPLHQSPIGVPSAIAGVEPPLISSPMSCG